MNTYKQNANTATENENNFSTKSHVELKLAESQKNAVIPIKAGFTQFEVINAIYDSKIFSEVKLTAGARLVLISLARHYNPSKDEFFPSYSCIASHTGVSKKSVERAIKELVGAGLITYRTEKVNRYRFTGRFFASVNLSVTPRQNDGCEQGHFDAQTNNHEKRINNETIFSKKVSFDENAKKQAGTEIHQSNDRNIDSNKKVGETKIYEFGSFRGAGKNDANTAQNAYSVGKSAQQGARYVVPPSERKGGSSFTPSVSTTNAYLESYRAARSEACSPLDFDYEHAKRWYHSLSAPLRKTSLARRLVEKYPQLLRE